MVVMVVVATLGATSACKRKEEVVAPKDDTWVPDETREPVAAAPSTTPELSEDERMSKAKTFYAEAEAEAARSNWSAAAGLYEQAYYLVPAKHGFALKVATASDKAGDCTKAISYFEHFVTYADPEKHQADLKSAKQRLGELKKKGC